MLTALGILGWVLILLFLLFLAGPRVEIDTTIRPITLPEDLDAYLKDSESAFADIVPGAEKTIIWAGEAGVKTAYSVVYLHGFSACRQESAPLSEIVAATLGANLFYTRLSGHGRSSEAMLEGTVNAWLNDIYQAVELGRRLGEKVIIIGLSTGGTAATWLASQAMAEELTGFVLISPNFAPADRRSPILTWPWGEQLAELIIGPEYSWEPCNPRHRRYWTHRFPTRALLAMMGLVRLTNSSPLASIEKPMLVLYSPADQLVSAKAIERTFARIGSKRKKLISYTDTAAPNQHVLAGDILAPGATGPLAEMIVDFVSSTEEQS
ncbi:alpha/beta hydrolase [Desulfogranum mediterraneum]|uniref:alpha/beta hydrolase n=1 Tax=Desulfogranum mediterraneum TaxID=160661 RepID=UPI0004101A8A|nr:alpha/beta fold hydrolase [Desulfogranum mediterraneum]